MRYLFIILFTAFLGCGGDPKMDRKNFTHEGCQYFYILIMHQELLFSGVGMGIAHKGNCTNHGGK